MIIGMVKIQLNQLRIHYSVFLIYNISICLVTWDQITSVFETLGSYPTSGHLNLSCPVAQCHSTKLALYLCVRRALDSGHLVFSVSFIL